MGIMIARLLRRKLYAWCNAYEKRVNANVRNYDLRDLDNEMNRKAYNFIDINKLSGWKLDHLGNERVSSWSLSLLVIGRCIAS